MASPGRDVVLSVMSACAVSEAQAVNLLKVKENARGSVGKISDGCIAL